MKVPAPLRPSRIAPGLLILLSMTGALAAPGCEATPPPTREHLVLEGDDYQRGLRHGEVLRSKVRSFHTTLLANTLLPFLNREHAGIAAALPEYRSERYQDGRFSREVLLDSARELERHIPLQYREEMRGVADGSGLAYEDVLILNTFADTVITVRAIAKAIHLAKAPRLLSVEVAGAGADGRDNDGDGEVDQPGEGIFSPWEPSAFASLQGVAPGATFRFVLQDPDGVDPAHLRIQAGTHVFTAESAAISMEELPEPPGSLGVTFTPPPEVWTEAGDALTLVVGAGDKTVSDTEPLHANFMREEQMTFVPHGSAKALHEVGNAGPETGRTQPTSLAFAVRGSATKDGQPLLAHSFALLDANTAHKHGVVFEHRPEGGQPFVVVGWAGVIWGFSGMNRAGLAAACNPSDSLDNAIVGRFIEQIGDFESAKLLMRGRPLGIALRRVLERHGTMAAGMGELAGTQHGAGWGCLLVDAAGALRAVEVDADVSKDGPAVEYGPETSDPGNLDAQGRPWSSEGPDDLRMAAHFRKNAQDMYRLELAGQRVVPQRYWSSYYYRSVQAWTRLGEALRGAGAMDADGAQALLQRTELMDVRDSMNSVIYEPATRRYRVAMGRVPAPLADFEPFELGGGTQ